MHQKVNNEQGLLARDAVIHLFIPKHNKRNLSE